MIRRMLYIALILSMLFSPALVSAQATRQFTLADLGQKDLLIKTIYDQNIIHFPYAAGPKLNRATLKLHTSHSPKLLASLSELTILLNDEPVGNLVLSPENAAPATLEFDLPLAGLHPGDNILLFRSNIRLNDGGCADVKDPDLWLRIFADSSIIFDESEQVVNPDLGQFPAPFAHLSTLPGSPQLTIVLPDHPTDAELTAAVQIASALGQAAQWKKPPVRAVLANQLDQLDMVNDHLIVINTGSRNSFVGTTANGLTASPVRQNKNRLMLVVSGADDVALLASADMLSTQSARKLLKGNQVIPQRVTVQPAKQRKSLETFAQLGFETERVRGIGLHDVYYPIDIPYDWKTTSDASLELHFSHATGMASTSEMKVFINGFSVTTVRFDNRNAKDGRLIIQLSPRQIHAGRNSLHLVFNLHIRDENCNYRYLEEAWAEVSAEKSLANLEHVNSESPLELNYLPSSMVTSDDLSHDLFIVPANPSSDDLTAMVRLAAKLGTYATADGVRPRAATDAKPLENQPKKETVILIGSPEKNQLIRQYDRQLPQPLTLVNGNVQPATGRDLLPEEQSGQVAYLESLSAPWDQRDALFVFSSQSPALLSRLVDIFPTVGHRWKSSGNVAVVTADHVTVLSLGSLAGATLSTTVRFILAGILMVIFMLISILGLVLVSRRNRSKQQESEDEG